MPLYDYECTACNFPFEEFHREGEEVQCPICHARPSKVMSRLADYTGQASMSVQYATRRAPSNLRDSHLTKVANNDTSFLRKPIGRQRVN